jgi:hypothetical protein
VEDDVLLPGDERAGAELGQQLPVEAALVEQVDAPQIRVRIPQSARRIRPSTLEWVKAD